jgi:hypothetical protein
LKRRDIALRYGTMPRFDNLSPGELEEIRRFVEETDIDVIDDEMRELVDKQWPWLVAKLPPQTKQ